MIDAIVDWLNDQGLGAGTDHSPLTSGIVTAMYKNSAKVALTLFDQSGAPTVVAKIGRRPSADASLKAEFASLNSLSSWGLQSLRQRIPQAIALGNVGGRLVLAQSYMAGRPMIAEYYRPGHTSDVGVVTNDFAVVGAWLEQFQQHSHESSVALDDAAIATWIRPVIERYRAEIGWTAPEQELFDGVLEQAEILRAAELPLTAVHGDFSVLNLLMSGREIAAVVDWELATSSGLPFRDIYKFPMSYCSYLDRAVSEPGDEVPGHPGWQEARKRWAAFGDWPNLAGLGYGYFGSGWFPDLVRGYIDQRFSSLGLDPRLHGVFFPLFLAEQAMTLEDPVFRAGYRSIIAAVAAEQEPLWRSELSAVS